jgi:hypothetical protein
MENQNSVKGNKDWVRIGSIPIGRIHLTVYPLLFDYGFLPPFPYNPTHSIPLALPTSTGTGARLVALLSLPTSKYPFEGIKTG